MAVSYLDFMEDTIEIPSLQIGKDYAHEALADFSSDWFPFPPKLEYVDVANSGPPDTHWTGQDRGNYMLNVTVVETALQ